MEKLDPGTKREENGSVRFYIGRGGRKCFHKAPHSKYLGLCGSLLQRLNSGDRKQPEKVGKGVGVAVSLQTGVALSPCGSGRPWAGFGSQACPPASTHRASSPTLFKANQPPNGGVLRK